MDKFRHASDKAAQYLANQIDKDGKLGDDEVSSDLCSQFKLTTLMLLSGHISEAHRLLDRIKKDFMQENGDFLSYPEKTGRERKSSSYPMSHFWSYMNSWIAMGAQRLGRFDVSIPAFKYCKTFYNPDHRAVCITEAYAEITDESTMDCLSTAHFGLLCLFMGDLEIAQECGEGLLNFIKLQPDIENKLLLRMSARTGALISDSPESMVPFYVIEKNRPDQLYFFLGYHGIFMTKLYQATRDTRFLDSAKFILDFALTCHESLCIFVFSHKVAYAAALVAAETKEAKYRRLAFGLGEYLTSIQTAEGLFCAEMEPIDKFDQSAELAIWLREIDNELKKSVM